MESIKKTDENGLRYGTNLRLGIETITERSRESWLNRLVLCPFAINRHQFEILALSHREPGEGIRVAVSEDNVWVSSEIAGPEEETVSRAGTNHAKEDNNVGLRETSAE